jgi:hypothetical protein
MPTKLIPLTQGLWTLVDAADYERLGIFKWCAHREHSGSFYAVRRDKKRILRLHREVLELPIGRLPEVDHISMDTLDNRRSNLRLCPLGGKRNAQNSGPRSANTSGFKGVTWDASHNRWLAQINADSRHYQLGRFGDPEAAARAYDAAALRLHGEFARLNFPA